MRARFPLDTAGGVQESGADIPRAGQALPWGQTVNWLNLVPDERRLLWVCCWVGTKPAPPFSKVRAWIPLREMGFDLMSFFCLWFVFFFFFNNSTPFTARAKR